MSSKAAPRPTAHDRPSPLIVVRMIVHRPWRVMVFSWGLALLASVVLIVGWLSGGLPITIDMMAYSIPGDAIHDRPEAVKRAFAASGTLSPAYLLVAFLHYFQEEDASLPPLVVGMVIW